MPNSAVVGLLRALLVADTAEFDQAMKRAGDAAKAWSKDLKQIGKEATAVGQTLTASITLPLVALGAGAAKLAIDFESSFAGVRKTVQASEAEFKALESQFRTLAKTIPVNVNELNKLGEAAGALGIPKEAIKGFVEVMAGLGVATDLTADQAANAIARIQNIFGAAGQDTDRFASTLVALGNAGASTEKEIVEMAQRIAGAGRTVGLTQAQVLAFASTLSSVGINAEAGGSAISRVFLKINAAVGEGGAELAKFAKAAQMSSADFKKAFETDAAGAVTKLIGEIGKLGKDAGSVIQGLLGKNIILTDTILRVAGAGELLTEQLGLANTAWQENTALTDETSKRYETVASQLTILWNKLKDVGITLGQALLPVLKNLMTVFDGFIPILEGAVKWFADLPAPVQAVAVALGLVAAAAGPALMLFGSMATGLGTLVGAFKTGGIAAEAFGGMLAFLAANPLVAVVAGLAALGTVIYLVATAETALEKELRTSATAFRDQTTALEKALTTYDALSGKQALTTEETKQLDAATRTLAAASGLSVEGFKAEAAKSDTLTTALRNQLAARKDLLAEGVKQAKAQMDEASALLREAENRRSVVLQLPTLSLDALKALNKEIAQHEARLAAATTAYQDLTGAQYRDIQLKKEGTVATAAATTATGANTAATDKGAKAAEKYAESLAKIGREISVGGVLDDIAEMTARVTEATKHGGLAAKALEQYTKQIEEWIRAGFKVPPILHDLMTENLALAKALIPVKDNTREILAMTPRLTSAQLSASVATAGLADEFQRFNNIIADPRGMDRILQGLQKGGLSFAELAAPQIKASEEALKRAQAWAETFGRIIGGVWDDVSAGLTEMFVQGLSGAQSFSDAFHNVWLGLERKLASVFADILNLFVNGLLRGMVGYLTGNQAAFSQAFSGLAGTGANSLLATALGTGTAVGSGAVPGLAMSTVNTSAVTGGAAAGGLGSAGALGAVAGSVAGAGAGGAVGYFVGFKSGSTAKGVGAGAATGAGVGALLGGPVGAGVGAGVGALAGWYGAVKAGKTINDMRDAFAASQGSMEAIQTRLIALGRADLWKPFAFGERNIDAFKESLGKIQEAFEKADKAAKELAEKQAKWLAALGTGFDKLLTAADKYGTVLPKSLRDTIAPLLESKDLTAEMRAQLSGLAADPSWRTLQGIAEKYGIALSGLGAKFQSARITDIALEYARDWQVLIDSGADLTAVVEGAADELNALYRDAKNNGVALPETLRPYMQRMVDLGLLVDDNGEKLEDLNGITFEDIEDKLLTQVLDVLSEIRDLLAEGLPRAAEQGAQGIRDAFSRTITIPIEWGDAGPPPRQAIPRPSIPTPTDPGPIGGDDERSRTPDPGIGLWGGTHGQYVDWGSGTAVTLHDKERVVPEGEALGGGATLITNVINLDGREIARNQVRHLPRTLQLAGL